MTQHTDALIASSDDHKFTLRLPEDIHGSLEIARSKEGRSLNSEILVRLQQTIEYDQLAGRINSGLIDFLAGCVQDLADMLPDEHRSDTKVQLMVELTRNLRQPK